MFEAGSRLVHRDDACTLTLRLEMWRNLFSDLYWWEYKIDSILKLHQTLSVLEDHFWGEFGPIFFFSKKELGYTVRILPSSINHYHINLETSV